jgi:outer membrane protein assembly factor BamD (BamD/ComL family)
MALMCSGKYLEAIRAFNKVLKIHPYDERAREQVDLAQRKIMESGSSSQSSPSKDQMKLI